MSEQIESAIKRVRGYWFVDGFTELVAGAVFIVLAALLLLGGSASPAAFSSWFLRMAGEIFIAKFAALLVAVLILWWLKEHFTYPRTGFVRGTPVAGPQAFRAIGNTLLLLLLPILALLATALLLTSPKSMVATMPVWFPVGVGAIWAALLVLSGEWMGIRRFRVMGGLALLVGAAIGCWQLVVGLPADSRLGLSQPSVLELINRTLASLGFLVLIFGVILVLSGLVAFLRYRKENPFPFAEDA